MVETSATAAGNGSSHRHTRCLARHGFAPGTPWQNSLEMSPLLLGLCFPRLECGPLGGRSGAEVGRSPAPPAPPKPAPSPHAPCSHSTPPPRMVSCGHALLFGSPLLGLPLHRPLLSHRAFRQGSPFELLAPMPQLHAPVAQPLHNHLAPHQAHRLVLPVQLIALPLARHRPVPLHHALRFPAQHLVQVPQHFAMHVQRDGCRPLMCFRACGPEKFLLTRRGKGKGIEDKGSTRRNSFHRPNSVARHALAPLGKYALAGFRPRDILLSKSFQNSILRRTFRPARLAGGPLSCCHLR